MQHNPLHRLANKKFFHSLLKFRVILTVLTLMKSNTTPKLPDHPPMLRKEIKSKTTFVMKGNILVFNYNMYCQIMNNVSTYSILTIKISLNTHFVFFCPLYSPVGVSLVRCQQQSANIPEDSILHYTSFQFGKYPDETFCHVHLRQLQCFQEKEIQMGMWNI